MLVCMYACTYIYMYVCIHAYIHVHTDGRGFFLKNPVLSTLPSSQMWDKMWDLPRDCQQHMTGGLVYARFDKLWWARTCIFPALECMQKVGQNSHVFSDCSIESESYRHLNNPKVEIMCRTPNTSSWHLLLVDAVNVFLWEFPHWYLQIDIKSICIWYK